ncbi:STAS domain-containing protein [Streptomyces sp. NRRL B-24484]|uniref:STAS domain-containing protein n=1 Tax=Streptomyces sp. NRRL B-24484 TaxID=1463833 RepID=UPI0005BC673C|nr:STAS domain-containing protein [Streptomyces sp. NRRL B-24484]
MTSDDGLAQRAGPAPDLRIRTSSTAETVVCTVAGLLHLENEEQVQRALDAALGRRPAVLAVDLSGVVMFTSSGLNTLFVARRAAHAHGIPLVPLAPSTSVRRTLAITGTEVLFPIRPDLEPERHHRGPPAS